MNKLITDNKVPGSGPNFSKASICYNNKVRYRTQVPKYVDTCVSQILSVNMAFMIEIGKAECKVKITNFHAFL